MKAVVIALVIAAAFALVVNKDNAENVFKFTAWAEKYNKQYESTAAYDHAFQNFLKFQAKVAKLQAECRRTNCKTQWGMTKFADLSDQEFKSMYLNAQPMHLDAPINVSHIHTRRAPSKFDWRSQNGVVTPVKDQGQCGSCWAFSTTENVESMCFLKYKNQKILGPQQLVDCDPQSQGCGGGWTYWAFEYLINAGGQELESDYPYVAQNQPCQFDKSKIACAVKDFKYAIDPCKSGDCTGQIKLEGQLRDKLAMVGPFSICVNAASWSAYQGGVMSGASCPGGAGYIDHCVQLVGFDMSQNYYIVRNSWNTNWGDQGYIYLQTDSNTCALADVVTYAVIG